MQSRKGNIQSTYEEFASHIRKGLCQRSGEKWIDPKFFYNEKGSYLFDRICLQHEYYLTRAETEILERYSKDIVSNLKCTAASMIEFGNGSSLKTRIILKHFSSQGVDVMYFPIDISQTALISSITSLSSEFRNLDIIGISSEYLEGIRKIFCLIDASTSIPRKKVIFFLGSSIGNFEPDTTRSFLNSIRHSMQTDKGDSLFIGFDLEKDPHILESAYNDRAGITSKFNLNLLKRINNDLGGTFNLRDFSHYATYNKKKKRIEMYIISKRNQEIYVRDLGQTVNLKKNERIHTENSYKYSIDEIKQLAEKSGFTVVKNYMDAKMWFDLVSLSKS